MKISLSEAVVIHNALELYRKEEFGVYMNDEMDEARRQLANKRLSTIDKLLGGFT